MKKIHLIRHAKSSWEDVSLKDIERPLSRRGIDACGFMAPHLLKAGCCFDAVFCSPAVRAQSTIERISKAIPEENVQWEIDAALYTFDGRRLLHWFGSLGESIHEVVIIGHNPALTDLCNTLSRGTIKNIPTCGYARLEAVEACPWPGISEVPFELKQFLKPKKLMKQHDGRTPDGHSTKPPR